MQFARAVAALSLTILWKDDSKLLKQQLLDDFWWYFSTGAAGWNCISSAVFAVPIGTENNWYAFVWPPLVFVW